jgi:hypothetical protein
MTVDIEAMKREAAQRHLPEYIRQSLLLQIAALEKQKEENGTRKDAVENSKSRKRNG